MGAWSKQKVNPSNINNGNEYEKGDRVSRQALNSIVNNSLYAADIAESAVLVNYEEVEPAGDVPLPYYTKAETNSLVSEGRVSPNLLINGDFQVNQRGLSVYEVNEKYTLDHWAARWRNKVSVLSKGVRLELNPEQSGQQHIALNQTIENYKALYGKTLTASVKVIAENTTTNKFVLRATAANHSYLNTNNIITPTEITGAGIYTLTFDFDETDMSDYSCFNIGIYCYGYAGDYIDIEWVKLEVGSVATPFSPKTYAQELLDCQRYFFEYACNISAITASDAYNLYPPISLPTKLRINSPTLTITTPYVVRGEGSQISGNPTITFSTNNNQQQLELKVGGLGSVFTTYKCYSVHNGTFTLDAEIY